MIVFVGLHCITIDVRHQFGDNTAIGTKWQWLYSISRRSDIPWVRYPEDALFRWAAIPNNSTNCNP